MRILRVAATLVAGVLACLTRHIGGCRAVGLRGPGRHGRARRDLHGAHGELHVHAGHDVPQRLPRPAGADRLPHPDPRRVRQRRRDAGSRNLPYELDAKGTGYQLGLADRRHPERGVKICQNVGGAHPQTWYKSFNWDLATKAPITFDTLFKPGTKPLDVIFPVVEQYLQKQQGLIDGISPSVGLDPAKYQNFAHHR